MSSTTSDGKPLKIGHRLALLENRLRGVEECVAKLIVAFENMDMCVVAMDKFFVRNFGNAEQKEALRKAETKRAEDRKAEQDTALDGLLPTIVEKDVATGEETATKVAASALVTEDEAREKEMEEREAKLRELESVPLDQ